MKNDTNSEMEVSYRVSRQWHPNVSVRRAPVTHVTAECWTPNRFNHLFLIRINQTRARKKTIVFVTFWGHEHSGPGGASFFTQGHLGDLIPKASLFINMDHLAGKGYVEKEGKLVETGIDDERALMVSNGNTLLISIAKEAMMKHGLIPAIYLANAIIGDDEWVYRLTKGELPILSLM